MQQALSWLTTMRHACAALLDLSAVLRRCLVPLTAAAAFGLIATIPQTRTFLQGLSATCFSRGEGACESAIGFHATPGQFLAFCIWMMAFALAVWYCGRVLASYRAQAMNHSSLLGAAFERWVPRLLGLAVVAVTCFEILGANNRTPHTELRIFALAATAIMVAIPFELRFRYPDRVPRWIFATSLTGVLVAIVGSTVAAVDAPPLLILAMSFLAGASVAAVVIAAAPKLHTFVRAALAWGAVSLPAQTGILYIWKAAYLGQVRDAWGIAAPAALLLPSAFLLFVMYRQRLGFKTALDFLVEPVDEVRAGLSAAMAKLAPALPRPAAALVWICLSLTAAVAVYAAVDPFGATAVMIAPTLLFLLLTLGLLAATALAFAVPAVARLMIVLLLGAVLFFAGVPKADLSAARESLPGEWCDSPFALCHPGDSIRKYFKAWERQHPSQGTEAPIIVVAAAGGGSRAALHSASLLSRVDEATCGIFGDRVFAISGVSGGAIGAAAWSALRRDASADAAERRHCRSVKSDERPAPRSDALEQFLARDHLSPVLATALFSDLRRSAWPGESSSEPEGTRVGDRGQTLFSSIYDGYGGALQWLRDREVAVSTASNSLVSGFIEQASPLFGVQPLMLFNATAVEDGRRVVQGSVPLCPGDGYCTTGPALLTGAVDSARFAFVSPPRNEFVYAHDSSSNAWYKTQRSLVDGGYFDNSGIVTAMDVVEGLLAAGVRKERIYTIVISNDPSEGAARREVKDYAAPGAWTQLATPLVGLITAREGRSELARRQLVRLLGAGQVVHWPLGENTHDQVNADEQRRREESQRLAKISSLLKPPDSERRPAYSEVPLGWTLSPTSARAITGNAKFKAMYFEDPDAIVYESERNLRRALAGMRR